jgi:predicted TIM-barrel fold metal-dependent hydrolase
MDAAGIDVQVLSLNSPGVEQASPADQIALAAEANDFVADAIGRHPDRFPAFAVLPTAMPEKTAAESERRVGKQRFAGTLVNSHSRGRYLDDPFFWPGMRGVARSPGPFSSHRAAESDGRCVLRRLCSSGHRAFCDWRLGLAHRGGNAPSSNDPERRV